jgi:nucleotidyltransferase substrate binding protein (TIGR01987 family)
LNKEIRWKQRFKNFEKGFAALKVGVEVARPSPLEKQGIIQSFEFTFELAWKTLKDYLESKEVRTEFPRDVIIQAFRVELIEDGEVWMEMLDARNLISHTDDEVLAEQAWMKITMSYFPALTQLMAPLRPKL